MNPTAECRPSRTFARMAAPLLAAGLIEVVVHEVVDELRGGLVSLSLRLLGQQLLQLFEGDLLVAAHDEQPPDHALELAHVAGPGVVSEPVLGGDAEAPEGEALLIHEPIHVVAQQLGHVLGVLTQRRDGQRHAVQQRTQIGPEGRRRGTDDRRLRRCDEADVQLHRGHAAASGVPARGSIRHWSMALPSYQPRRSLVHRLQHQYAGHDGKQRKMVRQVLLRQCEGLDRRDALVGLDVDNPVDQRKPHGCKVLGRMAKGQRAGRITKPCSIVRQPSPLNRHLLGQIALHPPCDSTVAPH